MLSNESASKQVVCRVLSVLLPTDVAFMGGAALLAPYESQIPLVYRLAGQVFDFLLWHLSTSYTQPFCPQATCPTSTPVYSIWVSMELEMTGLK